MNTSVGSTLGTILRTLGDLLVLNLLWIICSLPLVTLGATTSALYGALFRRYRQKDFAVFHNFFECLKKNFVEGLLLELVVLPIFLIAGVDIWFGVMQQNALKTLYITSGTIIAVLGIIIVTMGFPLVANFKNKIRIHVKNSFLLAMVSPVQLIEIWLIWLVPWALMAYLPEVFLFRFGFFYMLWGFSGPAMATVSIMQKIYLRCGVTEGQEDLDEEAPDLWLDENNNIDHRE